jgi:hypothetical protein
LCSRPPDTLSVGRRGSIRPTRPDRRESPLGSYDHSSGAPATTIDHTRRRERAASDFPAVMSEHCDEGADTRRRFGRRAFSARRSITASTSYVARPSTIRTAAFFPDGRKIFPTERFTGSLVTRRWREMDSNPRSPVGRIYANTEIAADREHRGRRSAGKWRIMPIWHRRVISAADHPLRQIGQIGRVLRAFSRGCARLDGKRSSRGRLIWRSRDLPRQETASAGNALLQCTERAAVLSAQAEGAPRASAGRARPSARSGSIDWFLAWRPPWHLGPQAQPEPNHWYVSLPIPKHV